MNVSVIIPTWNRAGSIRKAVDSALNQTVSPLEVLVCDDGSTDNTQEIIQGIDDPRVRWIPGIRGGRPAIPRNRGIIASRGDWLAFLDSDDEWLPNKLEKQFALVSGTSIKAVCSNAHRLIPGQGIVGPYLNIREKTSFSFFDLLKVNNMICSSALVHKSIFDNVKGFPEKKELIVGEDYALWLRAATITKFAYLNEELLYYQDDAANSIRAQGQSVWMQKKIVLDDFLEWAESIAKLSCWSEYVVFAKLQYIYAKLRAAKK